MCARGYTCLCVLSCHVFDVYVNIKDARSDSSGGFPPRPVCFDVILTLPDEGLAGVQEDVTALHDHTLYGQVLTDVLGVAHFIVHHPGTRNTYTNSKDTHARTDLHSHTQTCRHRPARTKTDKHTLTYTCTNTHIQR